MITERAVGQLDSGVIAELDALLGYMRAARAASDWTRFVVLDRHFHRAIYQMSGYPRAVNAVDRLRDSSDRYVFAFASQHQGAVTSIAEHEAILKACKEGEATRARWLTETHIENGSKLLAPLINEPSDGQREEIALLTAADT
jgi:DNA-binding GntR family transcriptional regulator